MSLDDLRALVAPPDTAPSYDFSAVEAALGFTVPDDYRQMIGTYGAGAFGGYLGIAAPTIEDLVEGSDAPRQSLVDCREMFEDAEWVFPDGTTAPVVLGADIPPPFFPCGGGPGGEDLFWHMSSPDPNEWAAVTFGSGWVMDYHPGGLVAYLVDLISGRFPTGVFGSEAIQETQGTFVPSTAAR